MHTPPAFSTYVFIERIAPNAAMLHPHPQENASRVCDVLTSLGWAASLVGPEKPQRGGVLFFDSAEFDDAVLGDIADALNSSVEHGIGAYAYTLADSIDEDGQPALVFRRTGAVIPQVGNRIILTHTYLFDDQATTWLHGASNDLVEACTVMSAEIKNADILPVHSDVPQGSTLTPTGAEPHQHHPLDAVEIRHLHPTGQSEEAHDIARQIVDTLAMAGFSGPIILTDHREGDVPDSSRLTAGY